VVRQELQPAPHGPVRGHGQPELDIAGRGQAVDRDQLVKPGVIAERGPGQVRDDHPDAGRHGFAQGRVGLAGTSQDRIGVVQGQPGTVLLDLSRQRHDGRLVRYPHGQPFPSIADTSRLPART
jgi:hypothetical protein